MAEPEGGERPNSDHLPAEGGFLTKPVSGPPDNASQPQLDQLIETFSKIADLEGRRIGVQEERNKVAMRALEVSENSDRRQFEFHSKRLESEERGRDKSHSLARDVLRAVGFGVATILALVLGMAFFGGTEQSNIALDLMRDGGKAVGGGSALLLLVAGLRHLMRS